jgi:hypothetical protein
MGSAGIDKVFVSGLATIGVNGSIGAGETLALAGAAVKAISARTTTANPIISGAIILSERDANMLSNLPSK